ncbi:MAG TPA: phospholipase D-like domain-containing protein, partial [Stellaceae bacterium]|nr:phospholipase D-like domain-containing protein [Stellaceae bacterium]
ANAVLHSKTVVIDGVWSAVGSSNFDQRSVLFNDEVDAVVLGDKTAEAMEEMFRQDIAKATLVDLAQWRDRPFSERIDEFFSGLWQRLL